MFFFPLGRPFFLMGAMRAELEAVVEELKRWRDAGQESVYLEPGTLQALRDGVAAVRERAPAAELPENQTVAEPPAGPRPAAGASMPSDSGADLLKDYMERSGPAAPASKKAPAKAAKGAQPKGQGLPEGVKPIPEPEPFALPDGGKRARWEWLREKVLGDPVCREHVRPGKQVVFGVGDLDASIFFCGEAPGEDEETQGEPFVGKAGQLLTKIIGGMGLQREQVYIGNIMNWRPEHDKPFGNRPPVEAEINYCLPHLTAQLEIVQPKVIVALGLTAANGLLGHDPNRRMGKVRGQWMEFSGVPLIITYHPSYLLRNQTNQAKRLVWEDMLLVMEKTGLPISDKQRGYFLG